MLYRLRKSLARSRFFSLTRKILDTRPVRIIPANFCFVSMVSNDDVPMYLISMKSCYRRIGRGRVIVIVDRDMPSDSRTLLLQHFPGIEFQILEDIQVGRCQRGGTWERLLFLLDRSRDEYAVQVDCDTLAFGLDLSEVITCIEENRAFTLNGSNWSPMNLKIVSFPEIAAEARTITSDYIGQVAERLYDRLRDAPKLKYVRGSSGFAGFAKGGFSRERIEQFHVEMENLLSDRWKEWGTEQSASNFAIANSPNALVLPYPKYANFEPGFERGRSSFLHFIGTYRFDDGYFADLAKKEIEALM